MTDFNFASSDQSSPFSSEEKVRQIWAVTDPISKELELLCDLMRDLRQGSLGRNEETSGLIQGSSRTLNTRSDIMDCKGTPFSEKEFWKKVLQKIPETSNGSDNFLRGVSVSTT